MGKFRRLILLSAATFLIILPRARGQNDSLWSIVGEGGVGYGLSKDPLEQRISRYGISGLFRLMFKPDHRLRAGIETGWLHLASLDEVTLTSEFGEISLHATLNALPVMLVFDMNIWRLNLYTGVGYYHVISTVGGELDASSNARWMVGFYLATAYKYEITRDLVVAGQLRWCSIGEFGKTILLAEIFVAHPLFSW